jgi:ABC-2 type transport system ATP-binding protein
MLSVDGVTRTFGPVRALDEVSFTVRRGEVTGFVGGNGAGKTTAMRVIMRVLAPDAGAVALDGAPVTVGSARRFGYMPEERGLYPKMPAAEQVAYLGMLHGLDRATAFGRAIELLDRLGLAERAWEPVEKLSLGNAQRAQVAAALVHDPDVLILDEPFSGLDPLAVEAVQALLETFAARGAAVLYSSHQLDLVERLSDSLVIIAAGRIRAAGSRAELIAAQTHPQFALQLPPGRPTAWLAMFPGVSTVSDDGGEVIFEADDDVAQQVLRHALDSGPVIRFGPVQARLTEIFRGVVEATGPIAVRRKGVGA